MTRYDVLKQAADKFHRDNPIVWGLFRRFTFEAIDAGKDKFSVAAIWERIRWEMSISTSSGGDFKMNNNHRAFYARRFMEKYPQHDGFFETRYQRSEAA